MQRTKNLIIGAGPAGLSIASVLKKFNQEYILIEKANSAGAAWLNHYDRVHLHTVKDFSNLPFLKFPSHFPRYIGKNQLLEYFKLYVEKFNLSINYNEEAIEIENKTKWITKTSQTIYESENLIIATGYNSEPKIPKWKNQEIFKGEIIHSRFYKNGKKYKGKKVLVIGLGNTGGEIAIDLFESGAQVDISIRSPVRIVPRDLMGIPMQYSAILFTYFPDSISDFVSKHILKLFTEDLSSYGILTPEYGTVSQLTKQEKVPLIDIGTVSLIKQGLIRIKKDIHEFKETGVLFEDGDFSEYDSIILSTGYRTGLEKLFKDTDSILNSKGSPMIRGKESKVKGLYFLGFNNHLGGFLRNINKESISIGKEIVSKS
jgi:cation diffusion facilitator CzcD-associated flavoprotein CzcO